MSVCARPSVSIRRSRLGKVGLDDLVANGTMTPQLASVPHGRGQGPQERDDRRAPRTPARPRCCGRWPTRSRRNERLITVERALELGLDKFEDLHPNVVAFEERLPNSEGLGGVTMAELVRRSRCARTRSRVIVGEVLGDEIVTMLNAMSQGNDGSLSTIHANSSIEVFNRIATYALQAEERPAGRGHAHADRGLDQLRGVPAQAQRLHRPAARLHPRRRERPRGDRRRRPGALQRGVRLNGPGGSPCRTPRSPCIDDLAAYGYDPATVINRWA